MSEQRFPAPGTDRARTPFLLHGPSTSASLEGPLSTFTDLAEAELAVRGGAFGDLVAGAVPFDPASGTSSFYLGRRAAHRPSAAPARDTGSFFPDVPFNDTEIAGYIRLVDSVLPLLRSPGSALEKVVVARAERFRSTGSASIDPLHLYGRIADLYPRVHSYLVEHLHSPGVHTLGASPELFLRKSGDTITMTPLAGTVPRDPTLTPAEDERRARAELFTDKFLVEHRHLVEFMLANLAPFCTLVDHPGRPELIEAPGVWHLGTPIRARLRGFDVRVADLVSALHPSPAVCGVPQAESLDLITANESARGYYGGLVGWLDSDGDGEFYMALRGLDYDANDGLLTLRAGGGIVADSRLDVEFAETSAKLATMRHALGIVKPVRTRLPAPAVPAPRVPLVAAV
ncbi:isochorismate synthase MenF [Streptomyces sp. NPDC058961]|uniref:isochorismate synthase n=1 Tax=Streptomyces sp. NPDC058961 TaxID=3346680 RepID=UPI0036A60A12